MELKTHFHLAVRFLLLGVFLFSCIGCSRVGFVYNQADWYLTGELNELLDFSGDRKGALRREVDEFFKEHRQEELPKIAYFLHATGDLIAHSEATPAKIQDSLKDLEGLLKSTLLLSVTRSAKFLKSLSVEEISRFERNIRSKNEKIIEELQEETEKDYREDRFERLEDLFEFFIEDLSAEQKKILRAHVDGFHYEARTFWVQYRLSQQLEVVRLLRSGASEQSIAEFLRNWILKPELTRSPQYQDEFNRNKKRFADLVITLSMTFSPEQKSFFARRLKDLSKDLLKLAR